MTRKRLIVEFGMGADLHGEDVTKAAQRAVKDAISRCCLCGLVEIFGVTDPNVMLIEAKVGCPDPRRVEKAQVKEAIPFGDVSLELVSGGLTVPGLQLPQLGEGSNIVIAIAALTVFIDTEDPRRVPSGAATSEARS